MQKHLRLTNQSGWRRYRRTSTSPMGTSDPLVCGDSRHAGISISGTGAESACGLNKGLRFKESFRVDTVRAIADQFGEFIKFGQRFRQVLRR